jgi:hypothetical protein
MLNNTELQAEVSKNRITGELDIVKVKLEVQKQININEKERHENIIKEIEALKKSKITSFER